MSRLGTTIAITNTTKKTMKPKMIGLDLMFLFKIGNLVQRKLEVISHAFRI